MWAVVLPLIDTESTRCERWLTNLSSEDNIWPRTGLRLLSSWRRKKNLFVGAAQNFLDAEIFQADTVAADTKVFFSEYLNKTEMCWIDVLTLTNKSRSSVHSLSWKKSSWRKLNTFCLLVQYCSPTLINLKESGLFLSNTHLIMCTVL